jgi:hypothetical protein
VDLQQVRKSNMNKDAIKDFMYGGVAELMRNRTYYYYSSVAPEYCHWTEEGEQALAEYMTLVGRQMLMAEEKELDQRAKDMVLNKLKGDVKQSEQR